MYRMIYSDNLFLDRYAQTTTNNGEVIDDSGQGQGKQLNCLGIPVVWIFNLSELWTRVRRFRLSNGKGYGFWAKMISNIYWTTDHQDKEEMKHSKNLVSTLLKIFELVVMSNCLIIQGTFLNLKLFGISGPRFSSALRCGVSEGLSQSPGFNFGNDWKCRSDCRSCRNRTLCICCFTSHPC